MIYKVMDVNELNDELIAKYFPMLSSGRQQKIANLNNIHDRAVLFCCEIIARQCLSELCDAPEFSFSLLCNPGSKSILCNFGAEICIVQHENFVACAVSENYVGISIAPLKKFSFSEAQNRLSDVELRAVFAESAYSFGEIINLTECNEAKVIKRFAQLSSLKEAHFYASGRGIKPVRVATEFEFDGIQLVCTDKKYTISKSFIDEKNEIAVSVIERMK